MKNYNVSVYGVNQTTGEYKIIFRCISIIDWLKRGEQNAKNHNYNQFEFFSVPSLENKFSTRKIQIVNY